MNASIIVCQSTQSASVWYGNQCLDKDHYKTLSSNHVKQIFQSRATRVGPVAQGDVRICYVPPCIVLNVHDHTYGIDSGVSYLFDFNITTTNVQHAFPNACGYYIITLIVVLLVLQGGNINCTDKSGPMSSSKLGS